MRSLVRFSSARNAAIASFIASRLLRIWMKLRKSSISNRVAGYFMKRSEFLNIFGSTLLASKAVEAAPATPEVVAKPRCEGCDTQLINGRCIHTKHCYFCNAPKHYLDDRCETCGNGRLPYFNGTAMHSCFVTTNYPFSSGFESPLTGTRFVMETSHDFKHSQYGSRDTSRAGFGTRLRKL